MDRFQELLWDLGELIDVPLHVDKNRSCELLLDEKLCLHFEMDERGEYLLIASFISELPPGRFREDVLKQALKLNTSFHPYGTFAYIEKRNLLVLHKYLLASPLNGEKVLTFLESFVPEAEEWHSAIRNGQVAPPQHLRTHSATAPPYPLPKKNS